MKYYYPEHQEGYRRIKAEGKSAWNEIHGDEGYDNFGSRGFLEEVLPRLRFTSNSPRVLEYGCGTGPVACYLAERGFHVDAVDLIPEAIETAKGIAESRGLEIGYSVADVCDWPNPKEKYDIIVDSYCLQCIVFNADRKRLFSSIKARLNLNGYYLVSTAVLDAEHEKLIRKESIRDAATDIIYNRYGSTGLIDVRTGTVLRSIPDAADLPEAVSIAGQLYLPSRRHLRPDSLLTELDEAGFDITYHYDKHAGSMACRIQDAFLPL